jgi:hypothetical protein
VAIVLVGILAIGGSLAALSALGPSTTPAPSLAVAAPSSASPTTSTLSVAPSDAAFPNAAEAKLLDALPAAIRATCVRGRDQVDLVAAGFTGTVTGSQSGGGPSQSHIANKDPIMPPRSQASLACRPTEGPSAAWFLWYNLAGGVDPDSPAQTAVTNIGTHFGTPEGDCGQPPARASWRSSLGASGPAVCLKDSGPGRQPWIYWSFGSAHVLGVATASVGHYPALYDWWQALTPFLN